MFNRLTFGGFTLSYQWGTRGDLNSYLSIYKTGTLPLSHSFFLLEGSWTPILIVIDFKSIVFTYFTTSMDLGRTRTYKAYASPVSNRVVSPITAKYRYEGIEPSCPWSKHGVFPLDEYLSTCRVELPYFDATGRCFTIKLCWLRKENYLFFFVFQF